MNILVTGASGFIGKRFLTLLLNKGFQVKALLRNEKKSAELPSNVEIVLGDLTQPETLLTACKNIDIIFHLGGYAHAWEENNPEFSHQHHQINFLGTQNLVTAALQENVKHFIFFSTVKAVADSHTIIDESWDKQPTTPYGLAKRNAENVVLAAKNQGMHVCILRPALVYGPGWKGNLATMLKAVQKNLFPPLPATTYRRSMIGIDDLCQAALLAIQSIANGKIYFVTDGVDYSTRDLYLAMRKSLNKSIPKWSVPLWIFKILAKCGDMGTILMRRRLPFNSDALEKLFGAAQYNSERIRNELGFMPVYPLEKALTEIVRN